MACVSRCNSQLPVAGGALAIEHDRFLGAEQIQESLKEATKSTICLGQITGTSYGSIPESQADSFAKDDQRDFAQAEVQEVEQVHWPGGKATLLQARMALKALVRSLHSAAEFASEEARHAAVCVQGVPGSLRQDAGIFLEAAGEGKESGIFKKSFF